MTVQPTSRRALLKGAALLTAVPVAAVGGVPVFDVVGEPEPIIPESPIMRIYRQWEALLDETEIAWEAVKEQGIEAEDAVYAAREPDRRRIEEALLAEPATTLHDLAAKVVVLTGEGGWAIPDETVLECAAIVGRDFAKMPRRLFEKEASAA